MNDYIKREAFLKTWCESYCRPKQNCREDCSFYDAITQFPAADVVKVVRCKDCKYWGIERGYKDTDPPKLNPQPDGTVYAECVHGPVEIGDSMYTDGDFYCAFGERKSRCGMSCFGLHAFDCDESEFCPSCGADMRPRDNE